MSSFICSANHFNKVESSLQMALSGRLNHYLHYDVTKWVDVKNLGVDDIYKKVESLMDAIRELSVICVNLQYRHNNPGEVDTLIACELEDLMKHKKFDSNRLNDVELVKAIQCMLYQIELEHLKGIRGLTELEQDALNFMNACVKSLMYTLVTLSQEYNDAKWSI